MTTLSTLRELFRTQSAKDTLDANSDPSVTLADQYINIAVREIVKTDSPVEFLSFSGVTVNIASGVNYIAIPSTIMRVDRVLINNSDASLIELQKMTWTQFNDFYGLENLYDSTITGTPESFCERNAKIMFNRFPDYSYTNGVRLLGLEAPVEMTDTGHVSGLPIEYDLLITYTALAIFYQKENEDNGELLKRFIELRDMERAKIKEQNEVAENEIVTLDSRVWVPSGIASRINQNRYYTGL
jgi:hypothetical protein